MLLSSERPFVGAFAFCIPGATLLCRNGLTQAVPPESDWNMANGQLRFPKNLGEPCSLLGESRLEIPGYQLQAVAAHSSAMEQTQRVNPRYRQAKETKRGGMAAGRHSVLIVPLNLANFTEGVGSSTPRGIRDVFRVMNPLLWTGVDQRSEETHQSLGALAYLRQ